MTSTVKRLLGRISGLDSIPKLPVAGGEKHGLVPNSGKPIRLTIVGESTAAGVGADVLDEALPGCLARAVAGLSGRPVSWQVLARDGATVRSATHKLVPQLAEYQSTAATATDIVVVVLGVNDLVRFRSSRVWRRDMTDLLSAIEATAPDAAILVAGIPPAYLSSALPKPLGVLAGRRARAMDQATAKIARAAGARVETVSHIGPHVDSGFFAADRFHPSPHGYLIWSRYLAVGVAGLVT